jgi:hypothetical protein
LQRPVDSHSSKQIGMMITISREKRKEKKKEKRNALTVEAPD